MDHARTYQMGTCPKCKQRFRLTLEADKECLCKRCFWAEIEASMRKIERWNEEDRERRSSLPPRYEE